MLRQLLTRFKLCAISGTPIKFASDFDTALRQMTLPLLVLESFWAFVTLEDCVVKCLQYEAIDLLSIVCIAATVRAR